MTDSGGKLSCSWPEARWLPRKDVSQRTWSVLPMFLPDSPRSGQTDLTSVTTESSAPHGRWPSPPLAEGVGSRSTPSLGTGTHMVPILPESATKPLTCEDVLNFQVCCNSAGKFLRC